MAVSAPKPGEIWLDDDPQNAPGEAHLVFMGEVRSAWTSDTPPPRNPTEARERRAPARVVIREAFRPALRGLERYSRVFVMVWLDRANRRPLVIHPPHASEPRGIFAVRSPVRPNPIGLSVARIISVDEASGVVEIDGIDFLDHTPVIDLKPYRPGIDAIPDAVVG